MNETQNRSFLSLSRWLRPAITVLAVLLVVQLLKMNASPRQSPPQHFYADEVKLLTDAQTAPLEEGMAVVFILQPPSLTTSDADRQAWSSHAKAMLEHQVASLVTFAGTHDVLKLHTGLIVTGEDHRMVRMRDENTLWTGFRMAVPLQPPTLDVFDEFFSSNRFSPSEADLIAVSAVVDAYRAALDAKLERSTIVMMTSAQPHEEYHNAVQAIESQPGNHRVMLVDPASYHEAASQKQPGQTSDATADKPGEPAKADHDATVPAEAVAATDVQADSLAVRIHQRLVQTAEAYRKVNQPSR